MMMSIGMRWCLAVAMMIFLPAYSYAQKFPSGDVRLVLGYAPGGGTDKLTRVLAMRLQSRHGVLFIVENRAGASGMIAAQYVSKQSADGRILLVTPSPPILVTPHIQPTFNPLKQLAPVSLLVKFPGVLTVLSSSPIKSLEDMIAEARRSPGKLSFGTSGAGGMNHLAIELLKKMSGVDMTHVPFQGSGPAITALIGKHVDMVHAAIQDIAPRVRSGEFRALGVDTVDRSPILPDVRSIREAGLSEFGVSNWIGVFGPPQLPDVLGAQARNAFAEILGSAEMQAYLAQDGLTGVGSTPQEFRQDIAREFEKMGALVRPLNLKI